MTKAPAHLTKWIENQAYFDFQAKIPALLAADENLIATLQQFTEALCCHLNTAYGFSLGEEPEIVDEARVAKCAALHEEIEQEVAALIKGFNEEVRSVLAIEERIYRDYLQKRTPLQMTRIEVHDRSQIIIDYLEGLLAWTELVRNDLRRGAEENK